MKYSIFLKSGAVIIFDKVKSIQDQKDGLLVTIDDEYGMESFRNFVYEHIVAVIPDGDKTSDGDMNIQVEMVGGKVLYKNTDGVTTRNGFMEIYSRNSKIFAMMRMESVISFYLVQ